MRRVFCAALLLLSACARRDEIDVAAAISLQDVLRDIAAAYERRTHEHVALNVAGSNVLARQIRAGAPVDVFIAADEKTMSSVRSYVDMPMPLLSNRLVVVSNLPLRGLPDLARCNRIAIGDPSAVPAGVYAREALGALWPSLSSRVIPCENVRAALAAVEAGNADAAIVYATDARMARRTRVAFAITPGPRIVYPVAMVRDSPHRDAARRFVEFLRSKQGEEIFTRYGFTVWSAVAQPPLSHRLVFQSGGLAAALQPKRLTPQPPLSHHLVFESGGLAAALQTSSNVRQKRG